ncbi:MAG: quinone oxidoreductase [Deltaproteobacteria bacterium]|nr:quinone oxidoreductase [Deltaproteobacteria bacterium]PWB62494.1 MAG: NADPH:quinone reductase [Deltaproteobacteria bacterium]
MKSIRVHQYGGPEALAMEDLPVPEPGKGEALVNIEAIGVNFIDVYQRMGLYRSPLPFTPGNEAEGVVVRTGPGAGEVKTGDRVAYAGVLGSYTEAAVVPSWRLVRLPAGLEAGWGAALMLQGMTAHYLAHAAYPLHPGDACLVHAAAGGVGLLLTQMAKGRGARVIGTVSTKEKAELARSFGADDVILYTEQDFEAEVRRLTGGKGVQVVYDSVGKTTFEKSLGCLSPRGYLALYGQSSGPVPPFDLQVLNSKGGLFVTRPSLAHYTATREELLQRANDVLGWAASGKLKVRIGARFPLSEAAEAHRQLAGRKTTGKVLLLP